MCVDMYIYSCIWIYVYAYTGVHLFIHVYVCFCIYIWYMLIYIVQDVWTNLKNDISFKLLFNLKIHRNYALPTLLYIVILKYYLSQSSHFKVILSPKDTPQWFHGFLCLLFTSVYPGERIDTPVLKKQH